MEKFTLGQVIDGLMNGRFIKAKAEVVKGGPKELVLHEGKIYCNTYPGGEMETDIFIPEWNDSATQWDAEYHPSHQPLDFLTIRFIKLEGGYRKHTEEHFAGKSIIDANTKIISRHDFHSHLTSVGYLGKQVIIFKGEWK